MCEALVFFDLTIQTGVSHEKGSVVIFLSCACFGAISGLSILSDPFACRFLLEVQGGETGRGRIASIIPAPSGARGCHQKDR